MIEPRPVINHPYCVTGADAQDKPFAAYAQTESRARAFMEDQRNKGSYNMLLWHESHVIGFAAHR